MHYFSKLLLPYTWDRNKSMDFLHRNILHILLVNTCIMGGSALVPFFSGEARKPQDSSPKRSCDSPGSVSSSWHYFTTLCCFAGCFRLSLAWCGSCWGCCPNPTSLRMICLTPVRRCSRVQFFFHRPWLIALRV